MFSELVYIIYVFIYYFLAQLIPQIIWGYIKNNLCYKSGIKKK